MKIRAQSLFRVRRIRRHQYRFELEGKRREAMLYGVMRKSVKAVIADIKLLRDVVDDEQRVQWRKRGSHVFLVIVDAHGEAVAFTQYLPSQISLKKVSRWIQKAIKTARIDIKPGLDGIDPDEFPSAENELLELFRIKEISSLSSQLQGLVDLFGEPMLVRSLEHIINAGGLNSARASSVAALRASSTINVQRTAVASPDIATRVAAAHALPEYPESMEREHLLMTLLADSEIDVVYRATVSSEFMLSDAVRGLLADLSASHSSAYVRAEASRIIS